MCLHTLVQNHCINKPPSVDVFHAFTMRIVWVAQYFPNLSAMTVNKLHQFGLLVS